MHEKKKSVMVVRLELKIPSLEITFRYHPAGLVMPNSDPHDGIFNPNLTTIYFWHSYSLMVYFTSKHLGV